MENQDGSSRQLTSEKASFQRGRRPRKVPPSFDFFPDDFMGGTFYLSPVSVGVFMRLLCYQWSHGVIPDDKNTLLRVAGCTEEEWKTAWSEIESKFPKSIDGCRRNDRLVIEREHKTQIRETNAQNALKRWTKKPENVVANSDSTRSTELTIRSKPNTKANPPSLEEVKAWVTQEGVNIDAEKFFHYYQSQGWIKGNGQPVKDWKATARYWQTEQQRVTGNTQAKGALFEVQRQEMSKAAFSEVFGHE